MAAYHNRDVDRASHIIDQRWKKPLSLRQQVKGMEAIGFSCRVRGGRLVCRGPVRPTELSSCYDVEIRLQSNDRPRIKIVSPQLHTRDGEDPIPHTYGPDAPCVYYPKGQYRDWTPSMPISSSVVPWLGLWLVHYEGWLATGYWEGGGIEHPPR